MIPQSIFIGLVVAIVGYFLQQKAWKHKLQEEIRQREFDECIKLIDALGRAVDKRLMAISVFHREVDKGPVDSDTLKEYRDSVKEWMHEFSSFKSKIYHYFGRSSMLVFENEVHGEIRRVSDIVLRTNKFGSKLSKGDKAEYAAVLRLSAKARHTAFKFLRELNEQLSNEEIGRTRLFNNVDVGDMDLMSRTYLTHRLFGLKS